jgi:hypothetical protein
MTVDVELFITIAEIAGIFVGFGALINVTRRDEIDKFKLWQIRALVTAGLGVIVVSLLPIAISRYGITGHNLWLICGLIYLFLNWFFSILVIRKPEIKKVLTTQVKGSTKWSNSLWIMFEIPLNVSLILILLGFYPELEPGLYTTAVFSQLFQAAFILSMLVFSKTPGEN